MIQAKYFSDLLDNLAGQFFCSKTAICVNDDFGIQISSNAKEYFTVAVIPEKLDNDLVVLGVLLDDSAHIPSRNGFTFVIYIDMAKISEKINADAIKIIETIIIAHEICHFAYYYELFIKAGDNTGILAHSNFTHEVSVSMIGAITKEHDVTSQTVFDEHNIDDLIKNISKFPKKHFSKGKDSKLDYRSFLIWFLDRLNFDNLLNEYKRKLI